ncbi:MAG: ABC transporter permease [Allosphingosinicella sp.]|uniref:ABC transporter permease n=1 Tax=Allosphingosinicella sp. TaxID=2823234 RepID=UPI0039466FA5
MWRNYLTVGLRATLRHRSYAFINVAGLALGIAAAVMVFLYVRFETGYDRWLPSADRIVQLQSTINPPDGDRRTSAMAPRVAVEAVRREFPELEQVVGMMKARTAIVHEGEPRWSDVYWADPNFFEVFDLPFVRGDKAGALRDLSSVVLTQSEALRYFGDADPIGRTIMVNRYGRDQALRVTGVIADVPPDSHLALQMIARFNPDIEVPYFLTAWGAHAGYVYGKLRPGADVAALNARMAEFEARNLPPDPGDGGQSTDDFLDFGFVRAVDLHLGPAVDGTMRPQGDPLAVRAFSVIALLILVIACVNFTNLTTARASQRAREVGVRKVLGATRPQLVAQFLAEAMALTGLATVIGLALVELLLPHFNALLGLELGFSYLGAGGLLLPALLLILVVGTIGGAYPAFYLSRFDPARVLRASAGPGASGSGRPRGALVVVQFAVSIALIVCAAVVYAQTMYARVSDPGYQRENMLVFHGVHPGLAASRDALKREMERIPGVEAAAYAGIVPGDEDKSSTSVRLAGRTRDEKIGFPSVDYGFFETLRIPLVAGRTFSDRFARDDGSVDFNPMTPDEAELLARGMNVVLNETAARRLGFADPRAALGAELSADLIEEGPVPATVVGIVSDVRFGSLREEVQPLMYRRFGLGLGKLVLRVSSSDPAAMREAAEAAWRRVVPDVPVDARFVEDDLAQLYDGDAVRGQVFALAAALAVLIACLGLFGLAAFTIERRRLEIAIRKVFGAGDADIVKLMVWQFSRPVLLANLIAWPVAWWLMRDWLNGFGQRIDLHAGWFLGAGALALLIAVLTVGGHALRASRTRPAFALRYE